MPTSDALNAALASYDRRSIAGGIPPVAPLDLSRWPGGSTGRTHRAFVRPEAWQPTRQSSRPLACRSVAAWHAVPGAATRRFEHEARGAVTDDLGHGQPGR